MQLQLLLASRLSVSLVLLQGTGPLFRHFRPRFPPATDSSLTKASRLNCTFVFRKVAAQPTTLPRPLSSHLGKLQWRGTGFVLHSSWQPQLLCLQLLVVLMRVFLVGP